MALEYLMFREKRKNTERDMAFFLLRKYVEEVIELKLSEALDESGPNKAEILGQGRGVLSHRHQSSGSRLNRLRRRSASARS